MNCQKTIISVCIAALAVTQTHASPWIMDEVTAEAEAPAQTWLISQIEDGAEEGKHAGTEAKSSGAEPCIEPSTASTGRLDSSEMPEDAEVKQGAAQWFEKLNLPQKTALTDGLTTTVALVGKIAEEKNPLIGGSIIGVLLVTALKFRLGTYTEQMAEPERTKSQAVLGALWGGATVNNLLVIAQVASPAPILAGLVAGLWVWATKSYCDC